MSSAVSKDCKNSGWAKLWNALHECVQRSVCNSVKGAAIVQLLNEQHSNQFSIFWFLAIALTAVLGVVLGLKHLEVSYDYSFLILPLLALWAGVSSTWSG